MANKILICKSWFTTVDMHASNMKFLWLELFKGEVYMQNTLCRREVTCIFFQLRLIYTSFLPIRYAWIYNFVLLNPN